MKAVRPRERWLLVAQDGWGLGHVSRQIGLARKVRARRPETDFLFLTYSEAAHLIWREGFASLKLPGDEWFRPPDQYALSPGSRTWLVNGVLATAVSACPASMYGKRSPRPHPTSAGIERVRRGGTRRGLAPAGRVRAPRTPRRGRHGSGGACGASPALF